MRQLALSEPDVDAIVGGNFDRLFPAVAART